MSKKEKRSDLLWSVLLAGVAAGGFYPISSVIADKLATSSTNKERVFLAIEAAIIAFGTPVIYKLTTNVKQKFPVNYVDYDKDMEYINNEEVIKCCDTCSNGCCRVPNSEKVGVTENGEPEGAHCLGYLPPKTKIKK